MPSASEAHAKFCDDHQAAAERYVINRTIAYTAFQNLTEAYEEAKKTLVESGALEVGQDGKIKAGWYKSDSGYESHRIEATSNVGVAAGGGAVGIAGAIGAPAAAWMLAGAFGTASTGAAISGLSGAAASSATAAWVGGGTVAAGGLGMAAAPFVLSGIGIVAGVSIIGIASLIARNRNNRNEKDMKDADATMKEAERRMEVNASTLKNLEHSAKQIQNQLTKASGVLEAVKTEEAVTFLDLALTEADQLLLELQKKLPHTRLYIGRPGPLQSVTHTKATKNSVTISWKDPDDGNSEITGYKVWYNPGFWGNGEFLKTTQKLEFTHTGLEPRKIYRYKIIPQNMMGEAEDQRYYPFEASTQSA